MESSIELNNFVFAKRPEINQTGQEISLATNYFAFKSIKPNKPDFHKYSINFVPEVPGDAAKLRRMLWNSIREQVETILDKTIFNNTMLYSQIYQIDIPELKTTVDGIDYIICIKYANIVPLNQSEALSIFKRFFNRLTRNMKYVPFRRNLFNMKNKSTVDNVEVYPGFNTSINLFPQGVYLNLNMMHKVLRPYSVYDELEKLKNDDYKTRANELMKGNVVLTRYTNDKTYIIDEVDLEKTPLSTFKTNDGVEKTFLQYYKEKYAINIRYQDQPLLRHHDKRGSKDIYLIPELCYLTGLTDEMRSNFNFMKSLANITKPSPHKKMQESIELIKNILNNDRSKEDVSNFGYTIECEPKCIYGRKLDAGQIIMSNDRFPATADDIDRKIQQPMKEQPGINNILIVVGDRDKQLADVFMNNLQGAMNSFKYQIGRPNVVTVRSIQARDWIETIRSNTNPSTQIVVLILPGGKGKGTNYNDLKRLLLIDCPIPSQVVLAGTLKKDKGLRSVINKVLIQICAKIGGTPWGIDDLPFTDKPTTVIGIDVYNCKGVSYIGCCATFNSDFTKYLPTVKHTRNPASISDLVAECIEESVNNVILFKFSFKQRQVLNYNI
jgi:aubergine-like protein